MQEEYIYKVVVIGGGPAGIMAAMQLGMRNINTVLLEKNNEIGKKLLLTGKGRCNFTTSQPKETIVKAFGKNGKFLYGPLSRFSNQELIEFFDSIGIHSKEERGHRMFPTSNSAIIVRNRLKGELEKNNVEIRYNTNVKEIRKRDDIFYIRLSDKSVIKSYNVIISTGGVSYPQSGSSGQGFIIAKKIGHTISDLKPTLSPIYVNNKTILKLAGLTLKNVELSFTKDNKTITKSFGDMIFTHKGISGPIVLEQSKIVYDNEDETKIIAHIDLKPALTKQQIKERINRDIQKSPQKTFHNFMKDLLPSSLIPVAQKYTEIQSHIIVKDINKEQRQKLIFFLKDFSFGIGNVFPVKYSIVTRGGINIKEIDPKTMQSKVVPGLYFAGEIIDLDGPTGGYNLQEAFTTGYIAGTSIPE
ncbi:NAD(P)/FAD-dependent oxidoreductase [Candidatus Dojkabacteria bacterium]|nr:NAD(P)/FAD-dependent oxidoreductase [Candidatus Dojkabacteria bacterium]